MAVYLHDIPLEKAKEIFNLALNQFELYKPLISEKIPIDEHALGRVLSEAVWAKISSPHYHASAMDGFALNSKKSNAAMPTNPVTLLVPEEAVYLDTGDVIPDWANCVVPIESTEALDESANIIAEIRSPYAIRIRAAVSPWAHIRSIGEDIVATELVLPVGKVLRPVDLGAAAASGHTHLFVHKLPLVSILPTGSELIPIGSEIHKGDIIEYNSIVLGSQVRDWGGLVNRYPITIDKFDQICENVLRAAEDSDLILLNAGSSAGAEDFSSSVIKKLGEVYVHGIAVRPGHPVILGTVFSKSGRPVPTIGVPGYPVSAAMTSEIFVKPLIRLWTGKKIEDDVVVEAQITKKITSPAGDDDYVRVVAARMENRYLAAPLSRGAGVITSLVRADGYTVIKRGVQGIEAGEKIEIHLNKNLQQINNTIMVIGSHDLTIDLLAEYMSKKDRRLVSSNVGSLGGLIALRRKEAHFGGSHLLDCDDGSYNISYIQKYLLDFGVQVALINWVYRDQGLIIKPGNPKDIHSLSDLKRDNVQFVNRQRGAGTRVLLDYHLDKLQIDPIVIKGYEQEEFTHLSVAASVGSGRADVGLGVAGAARALKLDFIPLYKERYDLVIDKAYLDSDLLTPLFEAMHDSAFRKSVQTLEGYDAADMGKVMLE